MVLLKLDIACAFDSVSSAFLLGTMIHLGFGARCESGSPSFCPWPRLMSSSTVCLDLPSSMPAACAKAIPYRPCCSRSPLMSSTPWSPKLPSRGFFNALLRDMSPPVYRVTPMMWLFSATRTAGTSFMREILRFFGKNLQYVRELRQVLWFPNSLL